MAHGDLCCLFRSLSLVLFIFTLLPIGNKGDYYDIPVHRKNSVVNILKRSSESTNGKLYSISLHDFFVIKEYSNKETWRQSWANVSHSAISRPLHTLQDGIEIPLPFEFPYRDLSLENLTISEMGCLIFSVQDEDEIRHVVYIAPLMTLYDKTWKEGNINYILDRDHLTVQWEKLRLATNQEDGVKTATFQVSIFADGKIVFSYKQIPFSLEKSKIAEFSPVIVGLVEVHVGDDGSEHETRFFLNSSHITNFSVISLTPKTDFYRYDVEGEETDSVTFNFFSEHLKHKRSAITNASPSLRPETDYGSVSPSLHSESYEDDGSFIDDQTIPPEYEKQVYKDHHNYYNSTIYTEPNKWQEYWVDLDNIKDNNIHIMLSNSYRKGVTVLLTFEFPFYGHKIRNITVTTGGFLFTGTHVHSWLAATQYIAPLMANFDPSLNNDSVIKYADNGTAFTTEWENVILKDKENAGIFTFQVTLLKSGDILFVYKQVPLSVTLISDLQHPVKVGLSDAYIIDRTIFFMRRKTIYEYHRVDLKRNIISNSTTIYFTALPTCLSMEDCQSCISVTLFSCIWCSERCSDGYDRSRQDWILNGCSQHTVPQVCPETQTREEPERHTETLSTEHVSIGTAGIIGLLFVVTMIVGFVIWVFYAYRNPHTASGQLLIKYRPSQWQWNRGEARYTAASVHM